MEKYCARQLGNSDIITSCGKIFSVRNGFLTPRKLGINSTGYRCVRIDGKSFLVHRPVAERFINKPDHVRNVVNHKDGDKLNNNVSNLEWCTISENIKHFHNELGGGAMSSIDHPRATLNEKQISILKYLIKMGANRSALAKLVDVDVQVVQKIARNETYKDIKEYDSSSSGVNNGRAKLSEESVREIKLAVSGKIAYNSIKEIAEKYGVSSTVITNIKRGKLWQKLK